LQGKAKRKTFDMNVGEEITINRAQRKDFDYYHKMLKAAFSEIYRVLKPERWLTVTFHNTDIKIYNSILKAVVLAGFDLEKVIYQPPARTSAKGLLQPYGSAIGDYYIRFRKSGTARGTPPETEIDKERYNRIVVDTVKGILARRGEPTPYSVIINNYPMIYEELKKNGYLFSAPEGVADILKFHIGKEFALVPVRNPTGELVGKKWWFENPDTVPYIERVPLEERVEKAIVNVLNRRVRASFDEILREILVTFPNSLTPDRERVKDILKGYAKPIAGKWALDPKVVERQDQHPKMISLLVTVGLKAGFQVWVAPNERGKLEQSIRGALLKNLSLPIPAENLTRVKEIDVLWLDGRQVRYEFEVENTTAITEAIVRGANIPDGKVSRVIVIPEERKKLLYRKVDEPALKERIERDNWSFIYYLDLTTFHDRVKSRRSVKLEDVDKLTRQLTKREQHEQRLDEFLQ
jgi:hypothetical protein